jgi:hypothetical protein
MSTWVDVATIANAAGITRRKARKALSRAYGDTSTWRGATLVVREVHGRGGRSGISYQVLASSLPPELQERLKVLQTPHEGRLNHGQKAQLERDWLLTVLHPALIHPKGSHERAATVREIAGRQHVHPSGQRRSLSERTIQRHLEAYETRGGFAGLGRAKRSDAGASRVIVTRTWDAAISFDTATKERIAEQVRQYIRGLIQAGEAPSGIQMLAAKKLADLTIANGFPLDRAERGRVCHIPKGHVQREAQHRKVHRFATDRKAHEDAKPRVRRIRAGLMPMAIVVGDVHPIDILVTRDDGSTIRTRAISWLDLATNRVRLDPVLLEKGEGIRNAHVIASFVAMVAEWGAPGTLYLDNGSEYNWAEFIDDALKLNELSGRRLIGIEDASARSSNVVRARPYNAAAKPIEGLFAVLEKTVFQTIPGWVGGDPMNQKKTRVGRPAQPYPGTFDDFRAAVAAAVAFYEVKPQDGSLKGKSPRAAWEDFVAGGWQGTAIDAKALLIAFSDAKVKTLRQGCFSHKGDVYTCPELQGFLGDKIVALVPKYGEWSQIPVRDEAGNLLGFAEKDRPYHFLDPEGAKEAGRRSRISADAIRDLARAVPAVDPNAERRAFVAALPTLPPAPVGAVIGLTDETAAIASRITETGADRADRKRREAEAEQDRIDREAREENELVRKYAALRGHR